MGQIGVTLWGGEGLPRSSLIDFVKRAEEMGYDSVWTGESWGREAFTFLAEAAVQTSRIRLAVGIANIYSRTPALMAMSALSLDEISNGRFILGLGTSGPIVIEQWHGVKYDRPLQRTREYVEIIKLILSGERVNYEGEIFKLQRFRLPITPVRRDTPIYIAAIGPQNLRLTGEVADGCIPFFPSTKHISYYQEELEAGARAAGRRVEDIELAPYTIVAVSEDGEAARNQARAHIAYYIGGMGTYYAGLLRRYGYVEEVAAIREAWDARDQEGAARQVPDEMVDSIVIAGTPKDARERLGEYHAAGFNHPVIVWAHGTTGPQVELTMRALAPCR